MKRLLALGVLFLTVIVLVSCSQSGLEKISFKEAEKKTKDTKGEYIAFIDKEDNRSEEYKKILEEVSDKKKIYYVELTSEIKTSDHYQNDFTGKYPSIKNGIYITNDGKGIKDNKVFEFSTETNINSNTNNESSLDEAVTKTRQFLDKEG